MSCYQCEANGRCYDAFSEHAHRCGAYNGVKTAKTAANTTELETILGKMRAEIEELRNFRAEDYDLEQYCEYFDAKIIFKDDVLEIIDKYKVESEE